MATTAYRRDSGLLVGFTRCTLGHLRTPRSDPVAFEVTNRPDQLTPDHKNQIEIMDPHRKRVLAAIIVPIQVVLALVAWRDLTTRPDDHVRGKKKLWRTAILLNPGNSVFYWLWGRR